MAQQLFQPVTDHSLVARQPALLAALCLLWLTLSACAGHRTESPEANHATTGNTALAASTEPAEDQAPRVAAQHIIPLQEDQSVYRVTEGKQEGQTLQAELTLVAEDLWVYRMADRRASYLRPGPDGGILLTRHEQHTQDAVLTYEPPMVFVPPVLELGEPYRGETQTKLTTGEESKPRTGTTRYRVTWMKRSDVVVEAGRFENACVIEFHREMDAGPVQFTMTTEAVYHPKGGLLRERSTRTIWLLGLVPLQETTHLERVE